MHEYEKQILLGSWENKSKLHSTCRAPNIVTSHINRMSSILCDIIPNNTILFKKFNTFVQLIEETNANVDLGNKDIMQHIAFLAVFQAQILHQSNVTEFSGSHRIKIVNTITNLSANDKNKDPLRCCSLTLTMEYIRFALNCSFSVRNSKNKHKLTDEIPRTECIASYPVYRSAQRKLPVLSICSAMRSMVETNRVLEQNLSGTILKDDLFMEDIADIFLIATLLFPVINRKYERCNNVINIKSSINLSNYKLFSGIFHENNYMEYQSFYYSQFGSWDTTGIFEYLQHINFLDENVMVEIFNKNLFPTIKNNIHSRSDDILMIYSPWYNCREKLDGKGANPNMYYTPEELPFSKYAVCETPDPPINRLPNCLVDVFFLFNFSNQHAGIKQKRRNPLSAVEFKKCVYIAFDYCNYLMHILNNSSMQLFVSPSAIRVPEVYCSNTAHVEYKRAYPLIPSEDLLAGFPVIPESSRPPSGQHAPFGASKGAEGGDRFRGYPLLDEKTIQDILGKAFSNLIARDSST